MSTRKFDPFVSEWVSFAKNPNHNLIEKCLKLAQILEYPELDIAKYIQKMVFLAKMVILDNFWPNMANF